MGDELFDVYNLYASRKYNKSDDISLNGVYTSSSLLDDTLDNSWRGVTTTATSSDWSYQGTFISFRRRYTCDY